ncbi:MAG: hypothetical protein HXX11_17040 [Desulfuromonadales bacterium]|nr:hypothetical protein [Desulfuromonadales bacterium]
MRIATDRFGLTVPIVSEALSGIRYIPSAGCIRTFLILLALLIATSLVRAQEFYCLGGVMLNPSDGKNSYAWQLEYIEGFGENLALGVAYLNEGHVPDHHRDGNALHLWARTRLLDHRLSLAAGIGPYYYYDTIPSTSRIGYKNDHGFGAIFSSSATWHRDDHWLFQLRTNWVDNFDTLNSFSVLAGIGYDFGEPVAAPPEHRPPNLESEKTKNEIVISVGQTIVNSFKSQKSAAIAIEYRRRIYPYVDWTGAWIYEGDSRLTRRNGLASQLWAVRDFLNDRLSLGIGAGAYFPIDERVHQVQSRRSGPICGIITLTSSYTIMSPWDVRVSWNRVITTYNNDTDVILGGVGFHFLSVCSFPSLEVHWNSVNRKRNRPYPMHHAPSWPASWATTVSG